MPDLTTPRCRATTVSPVPNYPREISCDLPGGHAGMHRAEVPNAHAVDGLGGVIEWHGITPEPGVWLVSYDTGGTDHVIPFPTEIEALRYVNGESSHRAWFVPFGVNFHDVVYGIGRPAEEAHRA